VASDHDGHQADPVVGVPQAVDLTMTTPASAPPAEPPAAAAPPLAWSEERVGGWGAAVGGVADVLRPTTRDEVAAAFAYAARARRPLALRGSGCSYGDASMNSGGLVLDLTRMNRLLEFDAARGIARMEPGVTIRDLWRQTIAHGYWPAVVPGTMQVSMGGAAAMNIHGKNNFAVGSFGKHVVELTLLAPNGELLVCSPEQNPDVYHATIGGFGMLGCILELKLALKRVYSGRLRVTAIATRDLEANLEAIEAHAPYADYLVGWLDGHGRGRALGRGLIHRADQLAPGEDPAGERMLRAELQDVPARLFGVVPKGWLWPGMWCATKLGGIPLVNRLKCSSGIREARRPPYLQSHGAFHFLLDYVPRWQWAFRPGGLIQFQPFVPAAAAGRVFRALFEACHAARLVPYLCVLKRHVSDPFLMTHAVDGFSMAMDFAVTRGNRAALWEHTHRMAEVVLEAGGRFYYAKDATLVASSFARIHGDGAVRQFRALKARLDPENVLQTELSRRLGLV
jgi:FAD/FMN-containing dehydrogenase